MGAILRKYGAGTGADIYIPVIKAGSMDFAAGGDWTPAAGDVKVSKDGGAQANIGTLPAYTNGAWKFVFTNAELTCAFLSVMVVDSATKAVEDQAILIETYGHASGQHAFDLDRAINDPTAGAVADQVWDEPRADHKGVDSFGRGAQVQHAAQATGGGSNYITFSNPAAYVGSVVLIVNGTGAGQARVISANVSSNAYVYPGWNTNPDATSEFVILPSGPAIMQAFGTAPAEALADLFLQRPISNAEPEAVLRTLYGAICALVNRVRIVNNKDLEIYKTDDATVLGTMTGTLDASQKPIKELDP